MVFFMEFKMELNDKTIVVLGLSFVLMASVITMVIFNSLLIFFDVLIIGTVAIVVPFSIFQFIDYRKLKNCEDAFPNFLRDLAEAKRSGLSLVQSIENCARSDYGELTQHITKIRNQLSWNIPMRNVMENFRKKFLKSSIINHSTLVIMQVEEAGGKTEDIMDSLADNIENIKEAENEKKTLMSQHILSMYALFFIFFGISVALIKFLMPLVDMTNMGELGMEGMGDMASMGVVGGSPCKYCVGAGTFDCMPCEIFFSTCSVMSFGSFDSAGCYYKSLFFIMIIIQGIFSGLVAGQIGAESLAVGARHSMIMTISGIVMFTISNFIGII